MPRINRREMSKYTNEISTMSFKDCITSIREELTLKYPVVRTKQKLNEKHRRFHVLEKIRLLAWQIMADVASGQSPVFKSVAHAAWENCSFDGRVNFKSNGKTKRIDFKRRNGRAEFAAVLFLLSKTHKLLMTQHTTTRREIYYENVGVFKSQKQVDDGMKEICYLLNTPAWELRVSAGSKGMVAGPAVLTLAGGESLDCGRPGGVCIPQSVSQVEKISSDARWVLIVEKEACFRRLVACGATHTLGPCILITGKGFPDVNSRILVCKFWEHLQIPILALVDADPHGFEIMCVYRFGSLSMAPYSGYLACPAVRWLGIHPGEIRPLLLDSKMLSARDRTKIHLMLTRDYVKRDENLKAQLEILLDGNVKAEIEGVASISNNYLTDVYVKNKIQHGEYL